MAEYTNPCDLCKHCDNCIDVCVLTEYSSKYYCKQYDCFINYEGTCTLGLYDNFRSNCYCDVPLTYQTENNCYNHENIVDVVNVIHCGIDENRVIRVALNDIELIPAPDVEPVKWIPSHHARMVLERLSGYEDTGLDPKEIISIIKDLDDCRNELCYKCGKYKERHLGACDGCRWYEKP